MLNIYSDSSYKVSLFFALILHLTLVLFLSVKYTHLRPNAVLISSNDIINATAVNERDFDNQMSKKMVSQESSPQQKTMPQDTTQKQVKKSGTTDQLQSILKKNLLDEQAQELAELKKEKQKYKKKITKQKEREWQKMQKMLQEQISAEQKQLADAQVEAHGSRLSGEVNKQLALIKQAIDSQWIKPEGIVTGDFCQLLINVAPGGVVLNVQILRSSGNLALDRSAQAAVFKASPLPVPEDSKMFNEFRVLKPMFNPEGMGGF